MLMKGRKWFCVVMFIAVIGFAIISSTAFAGDKNGLTKEGIKVHGHWKIEIFNPDGTRVSVTEFDNAYISNQHIPNILTGQYIYGGWAVQLWTSAGLGGHACDNAGSPYPCWIGENGVGYPAGYGMKSSNLTVNLTGAGSDVITLVGSVAADYSTVIERVNTWLAYCNTDQTVAACKSNTFDIGSVTGTYLASPLPTVQPGQLIQVTVSISFS